MKGSYYIRRVCYVETAMKIRKRQIKLVSEVVLSITERHNNDVKVYQAFYAERKIISFTHLYRVRLGTCC